MSPMEQMAEAIASEMERKLNTGHRVYAVDRISMQQTLEAIAMYWHDNHDPGDEDVQR